MSSKSRLIMNQLRQGFHSSAVKCRSPFMPPVTINHEFHKILPVKWIQPELPKLWSPLRSCDLEKLPKIDPDTLRIEFTPFSDLIDKLPEAERRIFTVGFGRRKDAINVYSEQILSKVRRHKYDNSSLDFKVAWATVKIRNFQDLLENNIANTSKNGSLKASLVQLIGKRQKWLRQMRQVDYKRFEWIIEVLGVIHKPYAKTMRIERKAAVDVLVNLYCNELRDQKMKKYKEYLETQKIPFLEYKLQSLLQIRKDEESINFPCSVVEDIDMTQKKLERLKNQNIVINPLAGSLQSS